MINIRKHFVLFVVDDPLACRDVYVDPAGNGVDIITPIEPDSAFAKRWFSAA